MSLYEVLKASKTNRFPDYWTLLWGRKLSASMIKTITGTLPITFLSNGTALINYRIFGTADGAGVQTENLWNRTFAINNSCLSSDDTINPFQGYGITDFIDISSFEEVSLCCKKATMTGITASYCLYDANKEYLSGVQYNNVRYLNITVGQAKYIRFTVYYQSVSVQMLLNKTVSNIPTYYIPYGYTIPLTVTSGTKSKDTDIYIGDSKLEENDLIDFSGQKVFTNTVTTVFNGTENWRYYGIYGGHHTFYYDYGESDKKQSIFLFCNKYTSTFISSQEETKNNTIRYQASITLWNINRVYIFDDRFDNAADFKEYLEQLYLANDPLVIIKQGKNTIEITPPAPLPTIETFKGINTLDSTETLGEVTIKGKIKEEKL